MKPYSFIQSARSLSNKVYGYSPSLCDTYDNSFKNDLNNAFTIPMPPKGSEDAAYVELVDIYLSLLSRASVLLVRQMNEAALANTPRGHLEKKLKEIDKDLRYHESH